MKYEIDDVISAWLNAGAGASGVKWNQPYTEGLIAKAASEAVYSPIGRDLSARIGDKWNARIMAEFTKRFASVAFYPGVAFRERLEEIMQDLLLEAPPAPVRPKGVNEHGVNLNIERAVEPVKPTKEETGFAIAWENTIETQGVSAVKPKGGIVWLTYPNNGGGYKYTVAEHERLLNRCIQLGLIKFAELYDGR